MDDEQETDAETMGILSQSRVWLWTRAKARPVAFCSPGCRAAYPVRSSSARELIRTPSSTKSVRRSTTTAGKARELRHVSACPRPPAVQTELLVLPPEERNGLMKSRLRQFLRSPLRSPAVHLAEFAGSCALRVLFLGGGKDPGLAGSDPPLRGSLPANCAVLLHLRAQHSFMQILPPPLRRPQRTIL